MKTAWNTGRWYTKAGQRIASKFDAEAGRIYFFDIDREIIGEIVAYHPHNEVDLRDKTMAGYDHMLYRGCHLSLELQRELEALALEVPYAKG